MRLPVNLLTGVIRSRPSAPHPPLSAAGASQFSHSDGEGAQLRRIPPTVLRTLPYSSYQKCATAQARGLPVMRLSADWFAGKWKHRNGRPEISSFSGSSVFELTDTV